MPHTVMPGETLWSIAAANSTTTRELAAANGLPETATVVADETIQILERRRQLNPASATENVHAGVMYLRRLLRDTGNVFIATAAYYQGQASVRRLRVLPETRRHVDSVMARRVRFGP